MVDTTTSPHYITEHWKNEIKQVLDDSLSLRNEIMWWTGDFPNGDILNVPTMGQLTVRDYVEGANITLEDTASQNFTLTIDKYKQTGIQITDKMKQDSSYINMLISKYKVEVVAALMRQLESDIAHLQASQTASNPNNIDGQDHRFVSVGVNNTGSDEDFKLAMLSLSVSKAMTSASSAFITPEVLYRLQGRSNLLSQGVYGTNQLLKEGGLIGKVIMAAQESRKLVGTIAGFQTYSHNDLDLNLSETITATSGTPFTTGTVTAGKANMFLGRETFVGAMRTDPDIVEFRKEEIKSDVIHATTRYGLKLYRPESLVVCLTDAS